MESILFKDLLPLWNYLGSILQRVFGKAQQGKNIDQVEFDKI